MSVTIDMAMLKGAIGKITHLASTIDSERASVQNGTPISLPSLGDGQLGVHSAWLRDQEPYLQGLHDIAELLAEKGATTSSFSVGSGMKDIKKLLGETLADKASMGNPNFPDEQKKYFEIFSRWQRDAPSMAAFHEKLGPEGTLRALNLWAQKPVDAANGQMPSKTQQALVDAMKTSLETATGPGGFTADEAKKFADGMVTAATVDPEDLVGRGPYNPSGALAFLLRDGRYGDSFIGEMGDRLDQYERQDHKGASGLWGHRPTNGVSFGDYVPWGDAATYDNLDPMAGLMSAMANNPKVAQDFFTNDDGDPPRAEYYIKERNWDQDGYDGISAVLDTATTDPTLLHGTPEQQHQAAVLASKTVEYFSERENRGDLPEILARNPQLGASEDLAHILSTYMPGVDKGIDNTGDIKDPGAGPQRFDAFNGNIDNIPVFDRDGLKNFMLMTTATDEGLAETTNGINHWRGENLGALADEMHAHPGGDKEALRNGIQDDGRLQGFLLSTMGEDKIHDAHEQDERTKATIDMFSDVVDLVPVPGMSHVAEGVGKDVLNYAIDEGKGAGFDALKEHLANAEDQAVGDYDDKADATLDRQKFTVAQVLADHHLLGDPKAMSPVTRNGDSVITYNDYSKLDDAQKNTVNSELFSADIGVGKYLNEHDYEEAYREMFHQGYFSKEG